MTSRSSLLDNPIVLSVILAACAVFIVFCMAMERRCDNTTTAVISVPSPTERYRYVRETREYAVQGKPVGMPQEAVRVEYVSSGRRLVDVWVRVEAD